MRHFLLILMSITFTTSCDHGNGLENSCLVNDPTNDLPWLKSEIEKLEQGYRDNPELYRYFYVYQAEFKGQTVFIFDSCCPFCNMVVPVMNCQGDLLGYMGSGNDFSKITRETIIWQPPDFACIL